MIPSGVELDFESQLEDEMQASWPASVAPNGLPGAKFTSEFLRIVPGRVLTNLGSALVVPPALHPMVPPQSHGMLHCIQASHLQTPLDSGRDNRLEVR